MRFLAFFLAFLPAFFAFFFAAIFRSPKKKAQRELKLVL